MEHLNQYDAYIQEVIKEIPEIIKETSNLNVLTKSSERDLVTEVDKAVERFLTKKINEQWPTHVLLGEETYQKDREYDTANLWVIDPIDGTTNFVKQRDGFCTIISYFESGTPMLTYIYEIQTDTLYHAMKDCGVFVNGQKIESVIDLHAKDALISLDTRRIYLNMPALLEKVIDTAFDIRNHGAAGLESARVISGKLGAFICYSGGPWDYSPLFLLSKELDLVFVTLDGNPLHINDGYSGFVFCTKHVYHELFEQ